MKGIETLKWRIRNFRKFHLPRYDRAARAGILIAITLLFSSFDFFQPENLIKKYGVEDGLSLGIVTSITQDNKGFMWFATEDGLNRFDGYTFKVYKYDPDNNNSLTGNFIRKVFTDSKGFLWVSSRHGLNRFDAKSETFLHYRHNPQTRNSIAGDDISDISESKSGNLWVASYKAGFSYYNRSKNTFTPYTQAQLPALTSDKVICLYEDTQGLLWVGTQEAGVNVFKVKDGKVLNKVSFPQSNLLEGANIKSIYEDHLSNIWIGTTNGLYLYRRNGTHIQITYGRRFFREGSIVLSVLEDSKEVLWVGVQDGGVYKLDLRELKGQETEKVSFTKVKGKDGVPLTSRSVQALYEDKDRNVWVGTYGEGISMVSDTKEKFTKFRMSQDNAAGTDQNNLRYYGVCTDEDHNLWLGTDGDGIYKCDPSGRLLRHYTSNSPGKGLTDNAILCAFKDSRNRLWFGSYAHGLFLYSKETDSFVNFKHHLTDSRSLGGNDVRVIFEDSKQNIWVGTNGGGLSLFNQTTHTFKNYNTANSRIVSNDVRAIAEDKQGRLWIGTYGGGLICYLPDTDVFKSYSYKLEGRDDVSSNVILALFLDKDQNLWIGTEEDGLISYSLSKKMIKQYNEKNGLANNTIYAVLPDLLGNIWVSTNKGISKLDVKTSKLYNYGSSDGLQTGQFNPGSALLSEKEGYMGFGGTKGLNIFYPGQLKEKLYSPKVLITGLQLFHRPGHVQDSEQRIEDGAALVLNPDEPVFTIEFGALDYARSEKCKYMYKLEGLDENWNYAGSQRSATYRYLAPGEYTFLVKASDQENTWGDNITSLRIKVLPPVWKTTTAYLFYLVVFAGLMYGVLVFFARQRRLRRRLMIAKAQGRKERRVARERLSFFTEVSHEFRTPLTLMLGPLEEMLSKEGSAETGKKLQMVYKNAHKLLSLINKLLDYRKAEAGSVVLQVEEGDIVGFVNEVCINFQELAHRKQIHFSVDTPSVLVQAWFDPEKLEMVLSNLLSNAFKYIGTGNRISVGVNLEGSSEESPGFVKVEVKDNGIGIPAKQQKHIFDWFYQGDPVTPMSSGLGLALAKKLVQLHKGKIFVQSKEGAGATFGFKIPLGKAHFDESVILLEKASCKKMEMETVSGFLTDDLPAHKSNTPKKGQKKILIVEDEEDIRKFLKYYLQERFFLLEATNGQEGIEQALTHHPDIIISDVKMPVMNGMEMCRELKSNIKTSHIPIVLLTARTALSHQKEGLETGADAYLMKPFSPELLQIKLRNLLEAQEKLKQFHLNLFNINAPQAERESSSSSLDEKFLKKIYEVLKENLENSDFNVNELAAALNMSRSLAYKKIKSLTGVSPVEYLRSLRLQESARLLRTGEFRVFEVACQVGFNDEKYFRQCFTKEFGCTPSEFMKTAEVC